MKSKPITMNDILVTISRFTKNNKELRGISYEDVESKRYKNALDTIRHLGQYFIAMRDLKSVEVCGAIEDALEKQIPKKHYGNCPVCNAVTIGYQGIPYKYCRECGQALKLGNINDWSEE